MVNGGRVDRLITVTITGTNDAPTITSLNSDHGQPCNSAEEGKVWIDGSFFDIDLSDLHTVTVDWGDGSDPDHDNVIGEILTSNDLSIANHDYGHGGMFTITVTVDDGNGGIDSETTTAVTQGVGVVDGTLYVIGTEGEDKVDIKLKGSDGGSDQLINVKGEFDKKGDKDKFDIDRLASEVDNIIIMLCGGDDDAHVHNNITLDALIRGGQGDDKLKGGSGNDSIYGGAGEDDIKGYDGDDLLDGGEDDDKLDGGKGNDIILGGAGDDDLKAGSDGGSDGGGDVLSGGYGDDKLHGGNGKDVLIGGAGEDEIKGGKGNDLLIGGIADFENNLAALDAAMAEWISDEDVVPTSLGLLTDDVEKDNLKGEQGIDLLVDGFCDHWKQ